MSILLCHLTDLHIADGTEPILKRADELSRAILSESDASTSHVILLLGGDFAYAGKPLQFHAANNLLQQVRYSIRAQIPVTTVAVPGNHDCDFAGDQTDRTASLAGLSIDQLHDRGTAAVLSKPLDAFFNFAEVGDFDAFPLATSPYLSTTELMCEGRSVSIILINTAVCSERYEQPGSLLFPTQLLRELRSPEARLQVALIHHPFNWQHQPDSLRQLREELETKSDIIFFGHEHVPEVSRRSVADSSTLFSPHTVYVQGGVLHDTSEPDTSNFVVVRVDLDSLTYRPAIFAKIGDGGPMRSYYSRTWQGPEESFRSVLLQPTVGARRLRDTFVQSLNDPGISIRHPSGRRVTLDEIFLYPDLWEVASNRADERESKAVKGNAVENRLRDEARVLLLGNSKCGKTAMLKRLFLFFHRIGKVPLFVDAERISGKAPKNVIAAILREVSEQYGSLTAQEYEQYDSGSRVLLLDNAVALSKSSKRRQAMLVELERHFSQVILAGEDTDPWYQDDIESKAGQPGLIAYVHLIVLGFGESLRARFVEQWLSLDPDWNDRSATDQQVDIQNCCDVIKKVIKHQLIPPYPVYLLVLLQQMEKGRTSVLDGSHSELYEALVTRILDRPARAQVSIKAKKRYLAALAFELWTRGVTRLTLEEFRAWHTSYWRTVKYDVPFDKLVDDLEMAQMIERSGRDVFFHYKYNYYFFLAYFLAANPMLPSAQDTIRHLCNRVHERDAAEVVLILANLSNDDSLVIKEMKRVADSLLAGEPVATLRDDVRNLDYLSNNLPRLILPDGTAGEHRESLRQEQDAVVPARDPLLARGSDGLTRKSGELQLDGMMQFVAASKAIQILGQTLRNVGDSTSGDEKQALLAAIVSLARRMLGYYLRVLGSDIDDWAENLAAFFREESPDLKYEDMLAQISQRIFGLSVIVCYAIIRNVASSAGGPAIDEVAADITAGSADLFVPLAEMAMHLERPGGLSSSEVEKIYYAGRESGFVQMVIRFFVRQHLYLFDANHKVVQEVCELVDIERKPKMLDSGSKRLAKPSHRLP